MNQLSEEAEALQNLLVSHATGGSEDNVEFVAARAADAIEAEFA